MRILFYNTELKFGGAERVMTILANKFTELRNDVLFSLNPEKPIISYSLDSAVSVRTHGGDFRKYNISTVFKEISSVRRDLKEFKPDVIITFFGKKTVLAKIASVGLHIPILFSQRNDPYTKTKSDAFFDWLAVRLSKMIVFQTIGAKSYYPRKIQSKSKIILNPCDIDRIESIECKKKQKKIVAVGRLVSQKNYPLLLNAFKVVYESNPEFQLFIYGSGPLQSMLEGLIKDLELSDVAHIFEPTPDIMKEICDASVFVLSSDYEGFPNVLIEAMALGLPCVSTNWSPQGGVCSLMSNGKNGLIVPRNDKVQMAQAIMSIISDSSLSEGLSREGRLIKDKVKSDTIAKSWIEFINKNI